MGRTSHETASAASRLENPRQRLVAVTAGYHHLAVTSERASKRRDPRRDPRLSGEAAMTKVASVLDVRGVQLQESFYLSDEVLTYVPVSVAFAQKSCT